MPIMSQESEALEACAPTHSPSAATGARAHVFDASHVVNGSHVIESSHVSAGSHVTESIHMAGSCHMIPQRPTSLFRMASIQGGLNTPTLALTPSFTASLFEAGTPTLVLTPNTLNSLFSMVGLTPTSNVVSPCVGSGEGPSLDTFQAMTSSSNVEIQNTVPSAFQMESDVANSYDVVTTALETINTTESRFPMETTLIERTTPHDTMNTKFPMETSLTEFSVSTSSQPAEPHNTYSTYSTYVIQNAAEDLSMSNSHSSPPQSRHPSTTSHTRHASSSSSISSTQTSSHSRHKRPSSSSLSFTQTSSQPCHKRPSSSSLSSCSDDEDNLAAIDPHLAEAAAIAIVSDCMTPLVKEELKFSIQTKRMRTGLGQLTVEYNEPKPEQLSRDEELKRRRRRQRNRVAAQKCRNRRREKMETLEEESAQLCSDNSRLKKQIRVLHLEKQKLTFLMRCHDLSDQCPTQRKFAPPTQTQGEGPIQSKGAGLLSQAAQRAGLHSQAAQRARLHSQAAHGAELLLAAAEGTASFPPLDTPPSTATTASSSRASGGFLDDLSDTDSSDSFLGGSAGSSLASGSRMSKRK